MRIVIEHYRIQNCILWLLVISGALKPLLIYYNLKPDLTLLVLIAMILDIFFVIISRIKIFFERIKLVFLILIVAFYTLCLISLLYSPSPDYGMEKAFYMIIPCLGFIYPFFLRKLDLGMLYNMIFFLVVPVSLWFILFKFLLYNDGGFLNQIINRNRFLELRQDYLNLGYLLGILVLMAKQFSKKIVFEMTYP